MLNLDAEKPVERQITPRAKSRLASAGFQVSCIPSDEAVYHKPPRSFAAARPHVESLRCRIRIALNKAYASEELAGALPAAAAGSSSSSEPSEEILQPDAQACLSPATAEKCSLQDCETPTVAAHLLMEGPEGVSSLASTAATTPEVSPIPASQQKMANSEPLAIPEVPEVSAIDVETDCSEAALEEPFMDFAASGLEAAGIAAREDDKSEKSGGVGEPIFSSCFLGDATVAETTRHDVHNSVDTSSFLTPRSPRSEADAVEENQVVLDIADTRPPISDHRSTGVDEEHVGTAPCSHKQSESCAKHDHDRCIKGVSSLAVECASVAHTDTLLTQPSDPSLQTHSSAHTLQCECGRPCLRTEELSNIPREISNSGELPEHVSSHLELTPEPKAKKRRSGCCPCRRHRAAKKAQDPETTKANLSEQPNKWSDLSQQEVTVSGLIYEADIAERPSREERDDFV